MPAIIFRFTLSATKCLQRPGGPQFRHVELAWVREYLTDYLNTIGILGNGSQDDRCTYGVDTTTLEMIRPLFYFEENGWRGRRISGHRFSFRPKLKPIRPPFTLYVASGPAAQHLRCCARHSGIARHRCRSADRRQKRLNASYDLRIDRIFAETLGSYRRIWDQNGRDHYQQHHTACLPQHRTASTLLPKTRRRKSL